MEDAGADDNPMLASLRALAGVLFAPGVGGSVTASSALALFAPAHYVTYARCGVVRQCADRVRTVTHMARVVRWCFRRSICRIGCSMSCARCCRRRRRRVCRRPHRCVSVRRVCSRDVCDAQAMTKARTLLLAVQVTSCCVRD
jgi:hypothetical protein